MSIDGTCLDVADTPANDQAFGRPGSKREGSSGAFPQIRVVGLAECGTHAVIDAVIGRYTDAEQRLVPGLLGSLLPGMLVLADRGFFSYELWKNAAGTGADLLWRTKLNHVLPVERRLADGSFLSSIYPSQKDRRHRSNGLQVRVVEYLLDAAGARRRRDEIPAPHHDPRPSTGARLQSSPPSTPSAGSSRPRSTS